MSVWKIELPSGIIEITKQYIRNNMPGGTTEILIPEGVQSIGNEAFWDCTSLKSIVIPRSVINIEDHAFANCNRLETVTILGNVNRIGKHAFDNCTSLDPVTKAAILACVSNLPLIPLRDIVIPSSLIGKEVFGACRSLKEIKIPITEDWKCRNGLKDTPYSDRVLFFLYDLQNKERVNPSWDEVLTQYPEVGVADIIKFAGDKQNCRPPWAREDHQGLGDNTVSVIKRAFEYDELGAELSTWLSAKAAAVLACVGNRKQIYPDSLQGMIGAERPLPSEILANGSDVRHQEGAEGNEVIATKNDKPGARIDCNDNKRP